jgi:glucose-6-phosphate 1-dehydrogenase
VLKAIQPLNLGPGGDVARAQYAAGMIGGKPVPGYLEEQGIAPESATETYAAIRLSINNWRWQGVPFYLRSGKRLPRRVSEIAIQFKRPPGTLFAAEGGLQPRRQHALVPDPARRGPEPDPERQDPRPGDPHPAGEDELPLRDHLRLQHPEAYERLVLDAMIGDGTLFIRGDEAEESWKLYTPVLKFWQSQGRRAWSPTPPARGARRAPTSS